jgi:hypothetical protein
MRITCRYSDQHRTHTRCGTHHIGAFSANFRFRFRFTVLTLPQIPAPPKTVKFLEAFMLQCPDMECDPTPARHRHASSNLTYVFTGELQLELKRNISRSIFSMTVTCECDALSRYVPGEFKKFNNN